VTGPAPLPPPPGGAAPRRRPLRGRHRQRTLIARALDDLAADDWIQAWQPGPGDRLAVLRMRRDMRRWIRAPRRLP